MRVPESTEKLIQDMDDAVYDQVDKTRPELQNMRYMYARWALCHGFPIGGVAAMDVEQGG